MKICVTHIKRQKQQQYLFTYKLLNTVITKNIIYIQKHHNFDDNLHIIRQENEKYNLHSVWNDIIVLL